MIISVRTMATRWRAAQYGVKASLEEAAAHQADWLHYREGDITRRQSVNSCSSGARIVTPNGFEQNFVPSKGSSPGYAKPHVKYCST